MVVFVARYYFVHSRERFARMRRRALLGLVAAGGLSGCLRLEGASGTGTTGTGGASGETTAEATSAVAATTTESQGTEADTTSRDPADVPYPVGLSEEGADSLLYSSHQRALASRSFETRWRKVNETQSSIPHAKSFRVDSGVAVGEWTRHNGGPVSVYRSGNTGLWREDVGGRYVYGKSDAGFEWYKLAWQPEVLTQLSAWNWSSPEVADEGRPVTWEVTATDIADASQPPGYHSGTVESLSEASMTVDENGVIRELRATYTVAEANDGEVNQYTTRYGVFALDSVSVSKPAWTSTAADRYPKVRPTYTDDRRYVRIELESGSDIAANSRLVLVPDSNEDARFIAEIDKPLESGDTVYFSRDPSNPSNHQGRLSWGSRPTAGTPPELSGSHRLYAYKRTSLYFPGVSVE